MKNRLLVSWLNLYFQSPTHHFWEGPSGNIYLRLTGHGKKKRDRKTVDAPQPKEVIIFMLKQIEPQFGPKMKPKLQRFIKRLESELWQEDQRSGILTIKSHQ